MSGARKPKLDIDTTRERLMRLGMVHAAEQLEAQLSAAVKNSISNFLRKS